MKSPAPPTPIAKRHFQELLILLRVWHTHAQIAKAVRVPVWQVRNWIYRDFPNRWAFQEVNKKLGDFYLRSLKTQTKKDTEPCQ